MWPERDRPCPARDAQVIDHASFASATTMSEALSVDVFKGIIEAADGLAGTPAPEASPLLRLRRCLDDWATAPDRPPGPYRS